MQDVITIDDVRGDYPELKGVQYDLYWARALVRRGMTIAAGPFSEDMQRYTSWLESVGIGASNLIIAAAKGETLYDSVLRDKCARAAILEKVHGGAKLQVFKSSQVAFEFVSALGLDWKTQVLNPDPDVADQWNGKDFLRREAIEYGFADLNPRHYICESWNDFRFAIETLREETDYVIKLRPNSASTDGMEFFRRGEAPSQEVSDQFESNSGVIVEEFIHHYPASLVLEVSDSGVEILHQSMQFLKGIPIGRSVTIDHVIERRNGGGVGDHRGNISAPYGADLGDVPGWRMKRIGERIRAFAEEVILPSGYRGKFNVDLLMDARGEVMELRENPGEDQNLFMELRDVWCEINARTSHSMNCDDVGISAAEKHPDVTFVCGGNVFPGTHMGGFQDMQALLQKNGLLYSKDSLGCIPYHTALLEAGFGQGGLFVPAQTFDQAVRMFLHAEDVLNKG